MSYWQSLLFALLAGFSVFLSSASKPPPAPAPVPPPVYPLRAAPDADSTIDRAINALDPERVPWLFTALWQEITAEPLTIRAEGTYQSGPHRRARTEVEVQCGSARRGWQMICDGQAMWEVESNGSERPSCQKQVFQASEGSGERRTAPPNGSERVSLSGPLALLQSLRRDVVFTHRETVRWRGNDVILLTGARFPEQKAWLYFHPRQCRLVLDAQTLWPHRLEWWGPAPQVQGDVRLVQMEFRNPVLHHPVAESVFSFTPPAPGESDPPKGKSRSRSSDRISTGFPR